MTHSHDHHDGHHDHDHDAHAPIGSDPEPPLAARARAIEALLIEKGIVAAADIRREMDFLVSRTPADGARLVARAWVDPAFKARLLADPNSAAAELGLDITTPSNAQIVVVEDTPDVHHLIVCTLCSCYPRNLLGPPPVWYKSLPYRSRAVDDPRGVKREFGLELEPQVEGRVHDSTADMRYLVLPLRPAGTEHMTETELARLVTRDSMIGVTRPTLEPVPA